MKAWENFKKFAFKGNVIDMAVGVVMGSAFGAIVTSLVNDLIMPLIGQLTGGVNFSELKLILSPAQLEEGVVVKPENAICYGNFIQTIVNFFIIAFSIYLFVSLIAKARHKLDAKKLAEEAAAAEEAKRKAEEEAAAAEAAKGPSAEELLTEIRDLLKNGR